MSRKDNPKRKEIIKDCNKFGIFHILEEYKTKLNQKKPQIHHLARVVYSDYLLLSKSNNGRCNCITCTKKIRRLDPDTHPGHFRTAGSSLKHKFNDDNVYPQCMHCNVIMNGNYQKYTIAMIKIKGLERVEQILQDKELCKVKSYEYADNIIKWYKYISNNKNHSNLQN